jgi:hypothetical protein
MIRMWTIGNHWLLQFAVWGVAMCQRYLGLKIRLVLCCLGLMQLARLSAAVAAPATRPTYTPIDLFKVTGGTLSSSDLPAADVSVGGQLVGFHATTNSVGARVNHALLWNQSGTPTELMPTALTGFTNSFVNSTNGSSQVGYGTGPVSGGDGIIGHALLWTGSGASAIDLNPTNLTGITKSVAYAVSGNVQVGYGGGSAAGGVNGSHAMLWHGDPGTAVDLHPTSLSGYDNSVAYATDGVYEVGQAIGSVTNAHQHAMMWKGSADTAVDLSPTNLPQFNISIALGVGGGEEVGYGAHSTGSQPAHALLWMGGSMDAIDLNPTDLSGLSSSQALATNGLEQVGFAFRTASSWSDALLWNGSGSTTIDLATGLPAGTLTSAATSIDAQGNVFGYRVDTTGFTTGLYAVEWQVSVPEPATLVILAVLLTLIGLGRPTRRVRLYP